MILGGGRQPPSDGTSHWRFPVADKVMLRAKTKQDLIDLVFQYRLRSNIPVGDVARDLSDWYCHQYPSFCHQEASDLNPAIPMVSTEPMLNRVSRWASVLAHKMPRGGYELVDKVEAERRAGICAACRSQSLSWRGGCGGCSATTLQLLQALKKMRKTERDGNLGACSVTGWENSVAVHMIKENLEITTEQSSATPSHCWRRD